MMGICCKYTEWEGEKAGFAGGNLGQEMCWRADLRGKVNCVRDC